MFKTLNFSKCMFNTIENLQHFLVILKSVDFNTILIRSK